MSVVCLSVVVICLSVIETVSVSVSCLWWFRRGCQCHGVVFVCVVVVVVVCYAHIQRSHMNIVIEVTVGEGEGEGGGEGGGCGCGCFLMNRFLHSSLSLAMRFCCCDVGDADRLAEGEGEDVVVGEGVFQAGGCVVVVGVCVTGVSADRSGDESGEGGGNEAVLVSDIVVVFVIGSGVRADCGGRWKSAQLCRTGWKSAVVELSPW